MINIDANEPRAERDAGGRCLRQRDPVSRRGRLPTLPDGPVIRFHGAGARFYRFGSLGGIRFGLQKRVGAFDNRQRVVGVGGERRLLISMLATLSAGGGHDLGGIPGRGGGRSNQARCRRLVIPERSMRTNIALQLFDDVAGHATRSIADSDFGLD